MNSTKIQSYGFSLIFIFLLAFASTQTAYADCEGTKKLANEVVDKLVAGDFEGVRKNFNENMKQNLSAAQIKNVWIEMISKIGAYKSREKSLYQEYPDNTAVFTRLQMEKGKVIVEVRFGADGKIGGLWLRPA